MSIELFKNHLKRRKLSERTYNLYCSYLKRVEEFIGKPLQQATRKDIETYLDNKSNKLKSASLRVIIISLKLYFKWLKRPEIADFPLPRKENNKLVSSDLLTEEDVLKIINACDNIKDKALVSLLYDSAGRNSEIRNLKIKDVFIESNRTGYVVVDGKTGKRQIPLSFSIPILKQWINTHPFKDNPESYLFYGDKTKKKLSSFLVRHYILRACETAKLKKKVYPHIFRHSRLTDLDRKGLSHTAMKHYAGWTRQSNMPSVYSHFSQQDTSNLVYQADGITPRKRKKTILEPVVCIKCNTPNDKTNAYCYLCGIPLDKDTQKEYEISELLKMIIKEDPNLSKLIGERIKKLKL